MAKVKNAGYRTEVLFNTVRHTLCLLVRQSWWCYVAFWGLFFFFFRREMTQPQSTWRWSHPLSNPVPYCRADCLKLWFFSRTIVDWNSLPSETAMAKTPASFQSRLSTSPTLTVQVFLFPLPLLFFGNALRSLTKCQSSNCWILWILRK